MKYRKGSGNHDQCGIILRQGLLVNLVFSILLVLVVYFFADIIYYLNQPNEVAVLAESYLKIPGEVRVVLSIANARFLLS